MTKISFNEYMKESEQIKNETRKKLIHLNRQLIDNITDDENIKQKIFIRIDDDCYTGIIQSRHRLYLKSMEKELGILVTSEEERIIKFYEDNTSWDATRYIYRFEILMED